MDEMKRPDALEADPTLRMLMRQLAHRRALDGNDADRPKRPYTTMSAS